MFTLRLIYIAHVVWYYPSKTFYIFLYISWLVTMSSDMTDIWLYDLVILILVLRIERKMNWKEKEKWKENENNLESTVFSFDNNNIYIKA